MYIFLRRSLCVVLWSALLCMLPSCFDEYPKEGLFIINVLDEEHFNDCHIPGSIQLSLDELEKFAQTLDKKKSEVIIYCSNYMCTASSFAAKKLQEMGFESVWVYEAGMAEWYQKGLPTVGPCKKAYLDKKIAQPELEESTKVRIMSTDQLARRVQDIEK